MSKDYRLVYIIFKNTIHKDDQLGKSIVKNYLIYDATIQLAFMAQQLYIPYLQNCTFTIVSKIGISIKLVSNNNYMKQ